MAKWLRAYYLSECHTEQKTKTWRAASNTSEKKALVAN